MFPNCLLWKCFLWLMQCEVGHSLSNHPIFTQIPHGPTHIFQKKILKIPYIQIFGSWSLLIFELSAFKNDTQNLFRSVAYKIPFSKGCISLTSWDIYQKFWMWIADYPCVSFQPEFRVTATGVVLELDKSMTIVKKLKLTGTPYKIYKKTSFIQVGRYWSMVVSSVPLLSE